jgi:hypothetical protein
MTRIGVIVLVTFIAIPLLWFLLSVTLLGVYENVKVECGWAPRARCMNSTICVSPLLKRDVVASPCPRLDRVFNIYWLCSEIFGVLVMGTVVLSVPVTIIATCVYFCCCR